MAITSLTFISGLTSNNQIVEYVFRNFKLRELIKTMIRNSVNDGSIGDLEQYIYLELLQMDNERLLILFESNKLRPFISQIIKRQNFNGSFYRTVCIKEKPSVEFLNIEENEYDFLGDILFVFIKSQTEFSETKIYSDEEVKKILSFTLLDKYLISKRSMRQLSKSLNIPRKTISILINFAKNLTMEWFQKSGKYLDEEYIKQKYQ